MKEIYAMAKRIINIEREAISVLYDRLENAEEMETTELALSIIAIQKYKSSIKDEA